MQRMPTEPIQKGGGGFGTHHQACWVAIAAIVTLSLWIRMDDLGAWSRQPHRAFHDNQPILINFDGYFYLSMARDLLEGQYNAFDELRGVPEPQKRPMPPPMISLIAAAIAAITPFSLDWIATVLPVFLGVTLAIPLYLFSRLYGGGLMAAVAICVGLCSRYYVYRSNVGWFDTDCLNATLALSGTYLFLRFGMIGTARRYFYLAGGSLVSLFFFLWWDQTRTAVAVITLCPLALAAALYYRPKGNERWMAVGVVVLIVSTLLIWQGPRIFWLPVEKAMVAMGYIAKAQLGDFPNTAQSVMEQARPDLQSLARISTGNVMTFCLGFIGLGWLLVLKKRQAVPLLVLFALGCFSLLFARRFLIFLIPFIAIGLGFAIQQLWNLQWRWPRARVVVLFAAAVIGLFAVKESLQRVYWPKEISPIVAGQHRLSVESSADALVWAWWDHGYPIRYWSRRATINDGSLHNGPRTVSNAIPFSCNNPRQAANFIHFYALRGVQGLQAVLDRSESPAKGMQLVRRILAVGPEAAAPILRRSGLTPLHQWLDFFFPEQQREIYLFLDLRMARTAHWWHWFGSWDIATQQGTHGKFQLIRNCRLDGRQIQGPDLLVDAETGILTWKQRRLPLARIYHHNGRTLKRSDHQNDSRWYFAFHQASRVGALMERDFSETLFNQLYMFENPDLRYFSLHSHQFPYYQIWRVTSDGSPKARQER
jgi:dolichyl-diphosphooligosaccharide--protein glycosyltransferase